MPGLKKLENLYYTGYSLIHAIALIIILSSLSLMIITYRALNSQIIQSSIKADLAEFYCFQGFSIIADTNLNYNTVYAYNVGNGYNMTVKREKWGLYDLYSSVVITNETDTLYSKTALVGAEYDTSDRTALYLQKSISTFSVAGDVFINGDCYVPDGVFKPNYNYASNSIIPDVLFPSSDTLPRLNNIESVAAFFPITTLPETPQYLVISDSVVNSFNNKQQVIAADTVVITGAIVGKVIVRAYSITVDSGAFIDDAILIGESVTIKPNTTCRAQVFTGKNLYIGNNVSFLYPSTIYCLLGLDTSDVSTPEIIKINDGFSLSGDMFFINYGYALQSLISLGNTRLVEGRVYSNCNILLSGRYNGMVYVAGIINNRHGLLQKNLVSHISIDIDSLPQYFAFSNISNPGTKNKIVKWCQ